MKKTNKERFYESRGYKYALYCADEKNKCIPKYVRKQAIQWLDTIENNEDVYVDYKQFRVIQKILKLMNLPDNPRKTMLEAIDDYGYWMLVATLCTKKKSNNSRLYQRVLLEIARKNHKSFTTAIYMIICMVQGVPYSRYFCASPTLQLSKEVKLAMEKIIGCSPALRKEFKCTRDYIRMTSSNTEFMALAGTKDSMDGKLTHTAIIDEVGLLGNNRYVIESLSSSQIELEDKAIIQISTKYPSVSGDGNVFEEEISYLKDLLDDNKSTEQRYFSLLFEPDEELIKYWCENGTEEQRRVIIQANPNALKNENLYNEIFDKILLAEQFESRKQNCLCKHLNIQYFSMSNEKYIDSGQIERAFEDNEMNFYGKDIYIGIDLAQVRDNSSVSIGYFENGKVYCKVVLFIPEDQIDIKSATEKVDYRKMIEEGNCIVAGDWTCDYNIISEWIYNFIQENNCRCLFCGYDQREASALVYQLEGYGVPCIEVPQYSAVLGSPLAEMRKMIIDGDFKFNNFSYIKSNFVHAVVDYDTNMHMYLNKKKSNWKIDIAMSTADMVVGMLDVIKTKNADLIDDIYY